MAVDGHHILVLVGHCQNGVVGKDTTEMQAGEGCRITDGKHEGGLFGIRILDEFQIAEQGMLRIAGCSKLDACVDHLSVAPLLIDLRIQVEYGQEGMYLLQ